MQCVLVIFVLSSFLEKIMISVLRNFLAFLGCNFASLMLAYWVSGGNSSYPYINHILVTGMVFSFIIPPVLEELEYRKK